MGESGSVLRTTTTRGSCPKLNLCLLLLAACPALLFVVVVFTGCFPNHANSHTVFIYIVIFIMSYNLNFQKIFFFSHYFFSLKILDWVTCKRNNPCVKSSRLALFTHLDWTDVDVFLHLIYFTSRNNSPLRTVRWLWRMTLLMNSKHTVNLMAHK